MIARAFIAANDGDGQIGGTMQPPIDGMWGLSADRLAVVPGYGPDVEKNRQEARAIMARSGFGPDKRMRTKVQTRALSLYRNPAALLVDQLREVHIDAELDVVETSHWFPRISRKEYTIGLNTTGNGVDDPDQAFFENFSCRAQLQRMAPALDSKGNRRPPRHERFESKWEMCRHRSRHTGEGREGAGRNDDLQKFQI